MSRFILNPCKRSNRDFVNDLASRTFLRSELLKRTEKVVCFYLSSRSRSSDLTLKCSFLHQNRTAPSEIESETNFLPFIWISWGCQWKRKEMALIAQYERKLAYFVPRPSLVGRANWMRIQSASVSQSFWHSRFLFLVSSRMAPFFLGLFSHG